MVCCEVVGASILRNVEKAVVRLMDRVRRGNEFVASLMCYSMWLISIAWPRWKLSRDLITWVDLARCCVHLRYLVERRSEREVRVAGRACMRVVRVLELEATSPVSYWSGRQIVPLRKRELLLGTVLACCVRSLHVPQGLVSGNSSRSIGLAAWLSDHILDLCVAVKVESALVRRIACWLLLLELKLVYLHLPRLATRYRRFVSRDVHLLQLVRCIVPYIGVLVRKFRNQLTLFASHLFVLSFVHWFEVTLYYGPLITWCGVASPIALVALICHVMQWLVLITLLRTVSLTATEAILTHFVILIIKCNQLFSWNL